MATWTALTYAVGSLLTSTKMTQNQDNFTALMEKAAGAPVLANLYVTEAMLAALAVSQGKLKTTTAEYSATMVVTGSSFAETAVTRTAGQYAFGGFEGKGTQPTGNQSWYHKLGGGSNSASYANYAVLGATNNNLGDQTVTVYWQERYVQASPPYEPYRQGDAVPIFIFVLLDRSTGTVLATSTAEDPPWANNGPTIINPRGRMQQLARARLPFGWGEAKASPTKLAQYNAEMTKLRRFMADKANAPIIAAEMARKFTQAEKNADMPLIPHPFPGFDPAKHVVVVINPTDDDFCGNMHCRHTFLGDSVAEALHDDYLILDNSPMPGLATPANVMAVRAKWKLT